MTDQQKPEDEKFGSSGEANATNDAVAPTTDEDLDAALEDTFPASDPINFAGSSAGRSAENAENGPENPPVGTHPLAGTDDRDLDDAAADVGGDAANEDPDRR